MRYLFVTALACACAFAQPILDSPKAKGDVDFSTAITTKPTKSGTSDPAACVESELFYNKTSHTLKQCTGTNTWAAVGTGSGSSTFVGLTDVNASSPSDKQATFYDSATSKWVKRTIAGGPTGLLDFTTPWTPDFVTSGLYPLAFTWTGFHNFSGGALRLPESVFASLPTASSNTGKVYVVTDCATSSCSAGSGSTIVQMRSNGTSWAPLGGSGSGGDASTNTSSSVDSEVALFSGTGGKTLKRATGNGYAILTSGVLSTSAIIAEEWVPAGQSTGSSTTALGPGINSAANTPTDFSVGLTSLGTVPQAVTAVTFPRDATNKRWLSINRRIPTSATTLDVVINGQGSASAGSGNAYFTAEVGCPTASSWASVTYGTASTATVAVASATTFSATFTGVSLGSCAAGSPVQVRITRDGSNAADTYTLTASVVGFMLRWNR